MTDFLPKINTAADISIPDPEIDTSPLPRFGTAGFFKTKVLESVNSDLKKQHSNIVYKSRYHSYEIEETLEAKIARLTKEVAEVQQEVEHNANNLHLLGTERQLDNVEDLSEILKHIKVATLKNSNTAEIIPEEVSISNIKSESAKQHITKHNHPVFEVSSSQVSKIAKMTDRLAVLEKQIGLDELDTTDTRYKPILVSLQETRQRLKLITNSPAALEASANNLKTVIDTIGKIRSLEPSHMNPSSSSKASTDNSKSFVPDSENLDVDGTSRSTFQKVDYLYSKVDTIEKLETVMPKVLLRLKNLRELHADVLDTHSTVQEFDKLFLSLKTDVREWKEALADIQRKMDRLDVSSAENMDTIRKWNSDLNQKLDVNE